MRRTRQSGGSVPAETTVKELAEIVGATSDRLLEQLQEAGLSHVSEDEVVTNEDKQNLLKYLKRQYDGDHRWNRAEDFRNLRVD